MSKSVFHGGKDQLNVGGGIRGAEGKQEAGDHHSGWQTEAETGLKNSMAGQLDSRPVCVCVFV